MKLQIAFDDSTVEEMIRIGNEVREYVDIFELGTPLVYRFGVEGIKLLKREFPEKTILADFKIMDAGPFECDIAYSAGADITTVLAVSDDDTIRMSAEEAKRQNRELLVDMMNVENIKEKVEFLEEVGVDYICVHTGVDAQKRGENPMAELIEVKKHARNCRVSIAGGVKVDTIADIASHRPDVIIIGSGLTNVKNPAEAARKMREAVDSIE